MEVTVEELGKLKRKLTVEVPLSEVSATYDEVFSQIRSNVRVDGFRPGKYPRQLAEKRFKSLMAQEATRNLVPKYFERVLKEKNLRPATEPHFDNLDIDQRRPFRFNVEFEVVPEFEVPAPGSFTLEARTAQIEPDAVDQRIAEYRKSRSHLEDKGAEPAAEGDVVTVDFEGTLDGEPFAGSKGTDQPLELGAGRYLETFERELAQAVAGQEKSFDLTFPEDYNQASLVGKTARFRVTVKKVERRIPAALDEAFFAQFGKEITTESAFREFVEKQLMAEREREIEQGYREQIAEQIRRKVDFEVPQEPIERALAEFEHRLLHEDPDLLQDAEQLRVRKEEETKRQADGLRLAFVLEKFADGQGVRVESEELRNRFFLQAYLMQQNPEELLQSQYGSIILQQLREQMLHQKALARLVDLVLGRTPAAPVAEAGGESPAPGAEPRALGADSPVPGEEVR